MEPDLEAVGRSCARDDLLSHTGHHLCNVDGGSLATALTHDEGAVVPVQGAHAHLGGRLSDVVQDSSDLQSFACKSMREHCSWS